MGGRHSRHWGGWDEDWDNDNWHDYDYLVEHAKSGRSKCRFCHLPIKNSSLRFTTIIPTRLFRERTSGWYHFDCFFKEQNPSSVDEIGNFHELCDEDQSAIQKKIEEHNNTPPTIGRKRTISYSDGRYSDFRVEYAKSSRSMCMGCLRYITKGQTRISKKDHKSRKAKRLGGLERWHHVECFAKFRADIGYYGSGDELPGAAQLSKEDQQSLKVLLPRVPRDYAPSPPKRMNYSPEDIKKEMLMKQQNEELYALKDRISNLEMQDMTALLEENHQEIPSGTSNIISRLSDILYFGALQPCPQCKGQLEYNFGLGYKCTGNITEWIKCDYVTQDPKREECVIPNEIMKKSPLRSYKPEVKKRLFKTTASPSSSFILNEEPIVLDD